MWVIPAACCIAWRGVVGLVEGAGVAREVWGVVHSMLGALPSMVTELGSRYGSPLAFHQQHRSFEPPTVYDLQTRDLVPPVSHTAIIAARDADYKITTFFRLMPSTAWHPWGRNVLHSLK